MGHLSNKIGRGGRADLVGKYRFSKRNERGEKLDEFVKEKETVAKNTLCKLLPGRLDTWKSR